jgi:ABC-2 type transport system ATP-binding protein
MEPAIRIENLTKDYWVGFWRKRPYRALDRLSLEVQTGEVFGFLGPNGAGKTTTLKLLMQLIFPTAGAAAILGRPVGDVRSRQRIGYLPENPYFYDYLTAEELLQYYARLFGYSAADARRKTSELLDRIGIGPERRKQQLRKYSKGMIQRVGIAQALLNDPEVIFLDEPMSGLDPLGRREVRTLILELRDQGRTVFFSSHILADAEALCSRVAVVAAGQLAAMGRLSDILAFQIRGWELVIDGLAPDVLPKLTPVVTRSSEIAAGRYALEIGTDARPERVLSDIVATGATLVSLNPVRDTLEDFFVRRVAEVGEGSRGSDPTTRPAGGDDSGLRRKHAPGREQAAREDEVNPGRKNAPRLQEAAREDKKGE